LIKWAGLCKLYLQRDLERLSRFDMNPDTLNFISLAVLKARLNVILPFLFSLWMAWNDGRTNRIPNYLNLGCALSGLVYRLWFQGLPGLADGFLGLALGFGLLILFYVRGGMGAGDVKALAALGAWLGPLQTLFLFIYMAFSGLLLIVMVLWWRGLLWSKLRRFWNHLLNWVLLRSSPPLPPAAAAPALKSEKMPYGIALAMGMAILCWRSWRG
jgi:prepilin peptidase CpaA